MEDEQMWERLLNEQSALFKKTIEKNTELQARVVELERELSVWKVAFTSNDEEKMNLKKQVSKLERNIGSLRDDNPLALCLIDGDGNVFSQALIAQGRAGGSQAAQLLTKGITDYLAETEDGKDGGGSSSISGRAQIWVSVYCNKSGLRETFVTHQLCTADQFDAFITGFNQASPLFSLTDVGNGKEAADAKLKECLRVFTRFPQTSKVFFGGGHDNGYASTLNSLNNEGLLDKIILLRGYKDVAFELKALQLPFVEFEGVFMTQKIPTIYKKSANPIPIEPEKKPRSGVNNVQSSPGKLQLKTRLPSDTLSNTKLNPPPCNFYYLAVCKSGTVCRYGHDYELDAQDLAVLRINAKKSPCSLANKNQNCALGERQCPLGHVCPSGSKCRYYKAGRCKFVGIGMHDGTTMPTRERSNSTSGRTENETTPELNYPEGILTPDPTTPGVPWYARYQYPPFNFTPGATLPDRYFAST